MTPLETIERRLRAAAEGDFVIALYNPRSSRRHEPLRRALAILRTQRTARHARPAWCATRSATARRRESPTLGELREEDVDMLTIPRRRENSVTVAPRRAHGHAPGVPDVILLPRRDK